METTVDLVNVKRPTYGLPIRVFCTGCRTFSPCVPQIGDLLIIAIDEEEINSNSTNVLFFFIGGVTINAQVIPYGACRKLWKGAVRHARGGEKKDNEEKVELAARSHWSGRRLHKHARRVAARVLRRRKMPRRVGKERKRN